jgi:hypothetical protein
MSLTEVASERSRMPARLAAVAVAVITLVGVGACAFGPRGDEAGAQEPGPVRAADGATGASASPTPGQGTVTAPVPTVTTRPAGAGPTATGSAPVEITPSAARTTASPRPYAGCPQGEYQREVETYLARLGRFGPVTVDGIQSAADCRAIKEFQRRYDIRPPAGRAGPVTRRVAQRLADTDTAKCRAGAGTTFCVDLSLQTVWAMRDGRVAMRPTVTRTGMAGYRTPTGRYTVNFRNLREWSDPYEVWMPYWQRFTGGMGFHETTTYIHNGAIGSHGCVNLLPGDARRLWELGRVGTRVHVFGRRPGT